MSMPSRSRTGSGALVAGLLILVAVVAVVIALAASGATPQSVLNSFFPVANGTPATDQGHATRDLYGLVFAIGASILMSRFAQRSSEAHRARAEAEVLVSAAAGVATTDAATKSLLESLRILFDASRVEILSRREDDWFVEITSGEEDDHDGHEVRFEIDDDHALVIRGAMLDSQDQRLVTALTSRVSLTLHHQVMEADAAQLREIAEAESLRLGLFRTVASELRPPLDDVAERLDALRLASASADGALSDAVAQIHHVRRLVTNVLDAGRLEAGDVDVHLEMVAVADLVRRALEGVDTRGRTVTVDIPADAAPVATDPDGARRILENVVSNACRFSPLDQPVQVKGGVVGDLFEVLVVDRGPGISPTQRDVILAPFHRLSGEQLNAGLNLTVAAGLCELLGATLHLDDTPGGGLTVTVEFPLGATAR